MKARFAFVFAIVAVFSLLADVPAPGQHSIKPKYWRSARRWVVNFSPYTFDAPIADLTPDGKDGLWFALGQTLEDISCDGSMQNYAVSEPLWQISSLARDRDGRLWFSLGQSGRVGILSSKKKIDTQVIVPRRDFPDIRAIAFGPDGSLWFEDVGRRSVGRRTRNGVTSEIPLPNGEYPTAFAYCASRVWVVGLSRFGETLYVADADFNRFHTRTTWRGIGGLACGRGGALWFTRAAYAARPLTEGYIDHRGRVHETGGGLIDESVSGDAVDGAWFTGFQYRKSDDRREHMRFVLRHAHVRRKSSEYIVPLSMLTIGPVTLTSDGTIWMANELPYSLVRMTRRP